MSVRLPGVSTELAGAVRAVNAAYLRIPAGLRPEPAVWLPLEHEVERACVAGDRERAIAAIVAWRDHHLSCFSLALLNAPLHESEAA